MKRFRSYKIKFRVFQYKLSDGPLVKVECVIIVVELRQRLVSNTILTLRNSETINEESLRNQEKLLSFWKQSLSFDFRHFIWSYGPTTCKKLKDKQKNTNKQKNKQKKEQKFTVACLSIRLQFVACKTSTFWLVTRSFEANLWASMISRTRVCSYENNTH